LRDSDPRSGTPSYKSVPVLLSRSTGDCVPDGAASTWQDGDVPTGRTGADFAADTQARPHSGTTPT
jgi:hypothetical protein